MLRIFKFSKAHGVQKLLMDIEDFEFYRSRSWHMDSSERDHTLYLRSWTRPEERPGLNRTRIHFHRQVMQCPKGKIIDHINSNGLDNRKTNLRIVTNRENNKNATKRVDNNTGYKGVVKTPSGRFDAHIKCDLKNFRLGLFNTAEEAALAYNEAALRLFGAYAKLNEIPTKEDLSQSMNLNAESVTAQLNDLRRLPSTKKKNTAQRAKSKTKNKKW